MADLVAPGIYRMKIELPKSPLGYTNSYVIMAKRPLVVDTAFNRPECEESLRKEMAQIGITFEDTDLFLTHFHSDHAGLARLWAKEHSRVYISLVDAGLSLATGEGQVENERKFYARAGVPENELATIAVTHPGFYYASKEKIKYTLLNDNDEIIAGEYRFRCIAVPGHTPGQMCLFDEKSGILIGGDHILFDITPNIVEWDILPDSLRHYRESLKKIQALDIKQTLPGHRETGDVYARIDELLVHHDARLNEVVEVVSKHPGISTYEITAKLTWSIRAKNWEDFPITQKWFAVGEAQAHVSYLVSEGKLCEEINENGVAVYSVNSLLNQSI